MVHKTIAELNTFHSSLSQMLNANLSRMHNVLCNNVSHFVNVVFNHWLETMFAWNNDCVGCYEIYSFVYWRKLSSTLYSDCFSFFISSFSVRLTRRIPCWHERICIVQRTIWPRQYEIPLKRFRQSKICTNQNLGTNGFQRISLRYYTF